MISSCYVSPKFLKDISENEIIFNKFYENFFLENRKIAKETIFLINEKNIDLKEEYKKILHDLSGQNSRMHILINDFLLKLNFEQIEINDSKKSVDIIFDNISDIQKPIQLKVPYLEFPISETKFKNKIQSLAKFAKKITLFDPNIIDHLTNFSNEGFKIIKEDLNKIEKELPYENFRPKILDILEINNKKNNFNYVACYKASLKNILDIILTEKKKGIKIEILTCIKDVAQKNFKFLIEDIKNKYEKEEDNLKKEKIKTLLLSIKSILTSNENNENLLSINYEKILLKCFSKWKDVQVEVKIKNDWNVDGEQFYRRGMLVEGENVRGVICIGKGLNVYEIHKRKASRLRKERNYRLKLIDNPNEKKTYTVQSNFPNFDQKISPIELN